MNENVIILTNGRDYEVWGGIKELCKEKGFSYNYLKRLKFPFEYKGLFFIKVPFRVSNELVRGL